MKIVLLPSEVATVLVEALPYIRQFAGKSVVVKLGGAAIDRESVLHASACGEIRSAAA
jgi:acetylglutamate kinase